VDVVTAADDPKHGVTAMSREVACDDHSGFAREARKNMPSKQGRLSEPLLAPGDTSPSIELRSEQ
jgi:hypothetical protein